jgi:Subtilase family/Fervidolysin N-terminal prodomain
MRLMKRMVVLTMTLTLAMATLPSIKRGKVSSQSDRDSRKFVPGEIVVKYKSSMSEVEKQSARGRALGHRKMLLHPDDGDGEMELVEVPNHMSVEAALSNLKDDPAVSYAEPNWIYTHTETSNDPFYTNGSLWGMYGNSTTPANQFGSQAGEAWAASQVGSRTVYVGVSDEGIDLNHPDLAANIWTNPFDRVDGQDNDGNGFVDDIHGWDFAGNNNSIYDGTGDDHGTHVAGTIGAIGGNGAGVAGVNWNVTLISGKFLGASGGTSANAVRAVNYFTDLKTRHNLNIVATNNSWAAADILRLFTMRSSELPKQGSSSLRRQAMPARIMMPLLSIRPTTIRVWARAPNLLRATMR